MNPEGAKLEELVEHIRQASSEEERQKYAEEANKLHEQATGHAMKIDSHGNLETKSEEAKQCPALH